MLLLKRLASPWISLFEWLSRRGSTHNYPVDPWLISLPIGLALFGWVMVTSASIDTAFGPFYFSIRHAVYLILAFIAALLIVRCPSRWWHKHSVAIFSVGIALLVLVLLIGNEINGSRRWISLPGPLPTLQPSEIAKVGLVFYMARFINKYHEDLLHKPLSILRPVLVMLPLYLLLFIGRDFGSAAIYTAAVGGMLWLSGTSMKSIGSAMAMLGTAIVTMIVVEPYRVLRLMSYHDPWKDPYNTGYQLSQSLIAFGRGGFNGEGLGNGIQKLGFLPEAHNDFIFATIAEELGLLGALAILLLYGALALRIFRAARMAELLQQRFHSLVCYGVGLIIISQAGINIGVATGFLPTKGLTLPLISYGGSSLLLTSIMLAVVVRIDVEVRHMKANPDLLRPWRRQPVEMNFLPGL